MSKSLDKKSLLSFLFSEANSSLILLNRVSNIKSLKPSDIEMVEGIKRNSSKAFHEALGLSEQHKACDIISLLFTVTNSATFACGLIMGNNPEAQLVWMLHQVNPTTATDNDSEESGL